MNNTIDPWIYLGHFIDLKHHLKTFAGTYYGSRLPWILPGYLAYKAFSPIVAYYVLHLTFYYAASISLYLILKHTINRSTALLTALLMGTYCFFLRALGHDYIDGAGITYLLLTLLMLTLKGKPRLRLSMAGVFYGCLIYTQLFLIIYTPLLILYYHFMNRAHRQLSLPKQREKSRFEFCYIIYGFAGISLLLCTINYNLNNIFFFFMPIVTWTENFIQQGTNPWWIPISAFWRRAWWLLFPLITFFGSLRFLMSRKTALPNWQLLSFFQVYFIINLLMFAVLDLFIKQPVLSLTYYFSYLIPALFLAIGAQLSMTIGKDRFHLLLGVVLAILLLPFIVHIDAKWIPPFNLMLLPVIAGTAAVLVNFYKKEPVKSFTGSEVKAVLIAISLAIINILSTHALSYLQYFNNQTFLSLMNGAKSVLSMDPKIEAFYWYNANEPSGDIFRSIASMNLWGYRLINEEFPTIPSQNSENAPVRIPTLNNRIFLFSNLENAIDLANTTLATFGFKGEILNEKTIQDGARFYKITLIEVSKPE